MSGAVTLRALSGEEWRRLRLARMGAVEAMPYFGRALFALVPVAAPGLGTFAVGSDFRLYVDPAMLGERWSLPHAGAVLIHETGHVLREHAARAELVDIPVDRMMWNLAADAELNDDLIAAGLELPGDPVTPAALGCAVGLSAETYYRHLVPPGAARRDPDDDGAGGAGCGSGAGDRAPAWELPAHADLGSGRGLDGAAGDLVRTAVARAVQDAMRRAEGSGRGTVPAGVALWAEQQLAPAVVPWEKVLRAAVRCCVAEQAGQLHHSYRRPNRRAPAGLLLPSLRAPKIVVHLIIDTSGSMGADDLAAALAQTRAVLGQASVAAVRVTCCDAAASTPRLVRSIRDVTLTGGGGTDLRVGIEAALAARPPADVLAVFSDGATPWPARRLRVPLVVALIGEHAIDTAPGWAKTVRVGAAGAGRVAA
jgi:predicted metal-dependent peptidase